MMQAPHEEDRAFCNASHWSVVTLELVSSTNYSGFQMVLRVHVSFPRAAIASDPTVAV